MEAFEGKTVDELQKELYENHKDNKGQIKALIDSLAPLIKDSADASVLVPLLSQYLGMTIKNDELLLKLIAVIKKEAAGPADEDDMPKMMSKEERKELLKNYNDSMGKAV